MKMSTKLRYFRRAAAFRGHFIQINIFRCVSISTSSHVTKWHLSHKYAKFQYFSLTSVFWISYCGSVLCDQYFEYIFVNLLVSVILWNIFVSLHLWIIFVIHFLWITFVNHLCDSHFVYKFCEPFLRVSFCEPFLWFLRNIFVSHILWSFLWVPFCEPICWSLL